MRGFIFSLLLLFVSAWPVIFAKPIGLDRREVTTTIGTNNDKSFETESLAQLAVIAAIDDAFDTSSTTPNGGFSIAAKAQRQGLIKRIATRLLGTLGVPASMMQLIAAVPDDLLKKMIRQPISQLVATLSTLKQGKIPAVPGVTPKQLILQVLPNLNVPPAMVELIGAAPDALVQQMVDLPGSQLQGLITQLQQGKIPTIPGVSQKELVLQFMPNLGVPPAIVELIRAAPDSLVQQITSLPVAELQKVISDLKQGNIPNLPGLLPGLIGLPTNGTLLAGGV